MIFWPFGRRRDREEPQPDPLPAISAPDRPSGWRGSTRCVDRALSEARSVLDAPLDGASLRPLWAGGHGGPRRWSVYKAPIAGSKLTLSRLEADVPVAPDALFELLRTMDGKRIIDPFPREHHSEPIKRLRSRGGEAQVVFSEAPRFIIRPREYVTCDATSNRERLFVCKSIEVDDGPHAEVTPGRVRANLLFAMRVKPVEGSPGVSRLQMANWLDLGPTKKPTVPPLIANAVTEAWYFPALVERLNGYIDTHGLATDTKERQRPAAAGAGGGK